LLKLSCCAIIEVFGVWDGSPLLRPAVPDRLGGF
jgi:hypothetical protein